jgi:hypothetical protein
MTSFFSSFSSTPTLAQTAQNDDPYLEVVVTPSASAFYAGELFSVTITFRNTRPLPVGSSHAYNLREDTRESTSSGGSMRTRQGKIGRHLHSSSEASSSRSLPINAAPVLNDLESRFPYSPSANPSYRTPGWPGDMNEMDIRSPEGWGKKDHAGIGHSRKSRSLVLGKGMSPQEMVWALGGQGRFALHLTLTNSIAPPLPTRRPQGEMNIPASHPHSRKISVTSQSQLTSPPITARHTPDLSPIQESTARPGVYRNTSSHTASSSSRSAVNLSEDDSTGSGDTQSQTRRARPNASPLSPSRAPSYHNAYGTSMNQPPPIHPAIRAGEPRTTTILWAYTRLVAHFHPSNTYIPPDPLLPLRSLLLHQPIGSGSLDASSGTASSSRWDLSFGTGTIGNATQPTLTGSLFGLAKDLVYGGNGGSLAEERKRVWNMKDLPVLETTRSLLGVDVKLKEGESRDCKLIKAKLFADVGG